MSIENVESKIQGYLVEPGSDGVNSEAPQVLAKIKRVPNHLRKCDPNSDKYFEPRVLFLGPFHKDKVIPEESKQLKKNAASLFMRAAAAINTSLCLEMYRKIYDEVDTLMRCYQGEDDQKPTEEEEQIRRWREENAWMLFEDGCAVLYFICQTGERLEVVNNNDSVRYADLATEDLFKLENQLPYRVLEILMEHRFGRDNNSTSSKSMIDNFITNQILRIIPDLRISKVALASAKAFRRIPRSLYKRCRPFIGKIYIFLLGNRVYMEVLEVESEEEQASASSDCPPVHLLQHLRTRLVVVENPPSITSAGRRDQVLPCSYRSVTVLKSRGIIFMPHHSKYLTKINSRDRFGSVHVPSIVISTWTKNIFLNLVADEVSSDVPNKLEISSYLRFLDTLVDSPEDVKLLRTANIIHNSLGSDEHAAAFLNDITAYLPPDDTPLFRSVREKIQILYELDRFRLWVQLGEYVHSPWAFLATIGALLVLSLAMLQTYFTIFPLPAGFEEAKTKWQVAVHIMRELLWVVLLPFPLLLTLLWIIYLITCVLKRLFRMSLVAKIMFGSIVLFIFEVGVITFGVYVSYLQFH